MLQTNLSPTSVLRKDHVHLLLFPFCQLRSAYICSLFSGFCVCCSLSFCCWCSVLCMQLLRGFSPFKFAWFSVWAAPICFPVTCLCLLIVYLVVLSFSLPLILIPLPVFSSLRSKSPCHFCPTTFSQLFFFYLWHYVLSVFRGSIQNLASPHPTL